MGGSGISGVKVNGVMVLSLKLPNPSLTLLVTLTTLLATSKNKSIIKEVACLIAADSHP